jgi:transglutaminase superfamily protein
MMSKIRRLRDLNAEQLWIVLEATILLIFVSLALRILGFKRTSQTLRLNANPSTASTMPDELAQVKEIAHFVNRVASHLPFYSSCLVRSLVLRRILQSSHIASELHIGVRKSAETTQQFEAHAWVEYEGIPLNDSLDIETLYPRIYADNLGQVTWQ